MVVLRCPVHTSYYEYQVVHRKPKNLNNIYNSEYWRKVVKPYLQGTQALGIKLDLNEIRAIQYLFIQEVLPNANGRLNKFARNVQHEISNYLREFFNKGYSLPPELIDYFRSPEWIRLRDEIRKIRSTKQRISVAIDMSFAYLLARHSTNLQGLLLLENQTFEPLERVWSRQGTWAIALITIEALDDALRDWSHYKFLKGLDNTLSHNQVWWKDVVSPFENQSFLTSLKYKFMRDLVGYTENELVANILATAGGELGSVAIAEALRKYAFKSLYFLARSLYKIAMYSPALRVLSWASRIAWAGAMLLNNSILARIGWEIGIEWTLDGYIQTALHKFFSKVGLYDEATSRLIERKLIEEYWNLIYKTAVQGIPLTETEKDTLRFLENNLPEEVKDTLLIALRLEISKKKLYDLKNYFRDKAINEFFNEVDLTSLSDEEIENRLRELEDATQDYTKLWVLTENLTNGLLNVRRFLEEIRNMPNTPILNQVNPEFSNINRPAEFNFTRSENPYDYSYSYASTNSYYAYTIVRREWNLNISFQSPEIKLLLNYYAYEPDVSDYCYFRFFEFGLSFYAYLYYYTYVYFSTSQVPVSEYEKYALRIKELLRRGFVPINIKRCTDRIIISFKRRSKNLRPLIKKNCLAVIYEYERKYIVIPLIDPYLYINIYGYAIQNFKISSSKIVRSVSTSYEYDNAGNIYGNHTLVRYEFPRSFEDYKYVSASYNFSIYPENDVLIRSESSSKYVNTRYSKYVSKNTFIDRAFCYNTTETYSDIKVLLNHSDSSSQSEYNENESILASRNLPCPAPPKSIVVYKRYTKFICYPPPTPTNPSVFTLQDLKDALNNLLS